MEVLKIGSKGIEVQKVQEMLNSNFNCGLKEDGDYGQLTYNAVLQFQRSSTNLAGTGMVDYETLQTLIEYNNHRPVTFIEMSIMKDGSFVKQTSKKIGICLHHTAGNSSPYAVKSNWENDDRGRVATHFVIGGISEKNDTSNDGRILQVIPLENWGYHVATSRMGFSAEHNEETSSSYIGIEVCNWGMLTLKDGIYYNYVGGIVPPSQVCTLGKPFRTYKYWHKYTNAQIASLEKLICFLVNTFKFELEQWTNFDESWLELSWDALAHKRVLTTHSNFEYGKFDMFPQPELLEMLKRVYAKYSK